MTCHKLLLVHPDPHGAAMLSSMIRPMGLSLDEAEDDRTAARRLRARARRGTGRVVAAEPTGTDEAADTRAAGRRPGHGLPPLKKALEGPERRIFLEALSAPSWNRREASRILQINRTTLYKK